MSYIEESEAVNYGITSFDHMGRSLITVMQVVTLESWSKIMFNLMNADEPVFVSIFFLTLIFICSFFVLNIILAVIIEAFIKIQSNLLHEKIN